jgi:hypothetical protein
MATVSDTARGGGLVTGTQNDLVRMIEADDTNSNRLHQQINEGASAWFQSSFVGRSFVATFEGKLLSYELSQASFDELNRIKRLFFSAFVGASEELARRASSGAAGPIKPV